jgi:hypothetical protein
MLFYEKNLVPFDYVVHEGLTGGSRELNNPIQKKFRSFGQRPTSSTYIIISKMEREKLQ